MKTHYFDNAATTRVKDEVLKAALPYLTENYGNPSSSHKMGFVTKNAIVHAREQCAKAINADPEQIIFTSGATESNNIVYNQFDEVIQSAFEHPSMGGTPVNDLEDFLRYAGSFKSKFRFWLASCMMVNNEIGTIFPVQKYADLAHKSGMYFHTDATQAFGHMRIDVKNIGCDFLSLSAHKFGGFKGVGLLYIKEPDQFADKERYFYNIGGGQEKGFRSGTENVAGIVSMGAAMELCNHKPVVAEHCYRLKRKLLEELNERCPVEFIENRLAGYKHVNNICNISFKEINAEGLSILLDTAGFEVSTGSACHSGSSEPSAVLEAIGTPKEYLNWGSIRVSFSEENTLEEVGLLAEQICRIVTALQITHN